MATTVVVPVSLSTVDIVSQIFFPDTIHSLSLPIALWMERMRSAEFLSGA